MSFVARAVEGEVAGVAADAAAVQIDPAFGFVPTSAEFVVADCGLAGDGGAGGGAGGGADLAGLADLADLAGPPTLAIELERSVAPVDIKLVNRRGKDPHWSACLPVPSGVPISIFHAGNTSQGQEICKSTVFDGELGCTLTKLALLAVEGTTHYGMHCLLLKALLAMGCTACY